ncbi:hypothetical protein GCM10010503_05860 [Streptomyces lucensis JCM 4490]|uniref:Uncharacterized protein n=1 Tax=Streptomyces lucensis JCM 4490 TaxID=1306176 RepID=A0A918IV54_9ACTN|nr:hypothetical protein GCM10010503_05860 [Streptomyces lucensis JCM 4490]
MTRPGGTRSATSRTRSAYSGSASAYSSRVSSAGLWSLIRPILPHPTDIAPWPVRIAPLACGRSFRQTVRPRILTLMPACAGGTCHHRAGGDR